MYYLIARVYRDRLIHEPIVKIPTNHNHGMLTGSCDHCSPETMGAVEKKRGDDSGKAHFSETTGMFMVLSTWIITPLFVGCKPR